MFKKLLLLLFLQVVLLPPSISQAGTGPKPCMDFEFEQEPAGEPVTIISGMLC